MKHPIPIWLKEHEIRKGQHLSPSTEFKPKAEYILKKCIICEKEFKCTKNRAEVYGRKTCSKECAYKSISGERHPKWKDGISKKNQKIRSSKEYRKWRMRVLVRDNFTCQLCDREESWHADHIKPFSKYPELRFEISNGRTLCEECDLKTRLISGKYSKI